jgi:hypothetical protein
VLRSRRRVFGLPPEADGLEIQEVVLLAYSGAVNKAFLAETVPFAYISPG